MKRRDRGITLITLVIYIILTLVVLGMLSVLGANFRKNLNNTNAQTVHDIEFDKLNVQLLKETKNAENKINEAKTTPTKIIFTNGNTYTYDPVEKVVYLNDNIKIAESITSFSSEVKTINNRKQLTVNVEIDGKTRITDYVLAYSGPNKLPGGIKVGDYVNYTPEIGTYKVGSDATGYTGTDAPDPQVFTTQTGENALKWKVLSINEATGEMELIAATQTSNSIYFQGATGYNHAVDILNDICKDLYSNNSIGAVARSINIEDMTVKTTYKLSDFSEYGRTKYQMTAQYGASAKYPNIYIQEDGHTSLGLSESGKTGSEGLNNGKHNATTGITTYLDSTVDANSGCTTADSSMYVTYTYSYYEPENHLRTDLGVNNPVAGIFKTGTPYWIASRCVYAYTDYAYFGLRYLDSAGTTYYNFYLLWSSNDYPYAYGYGARPVVSLPSSTKITLDSVNTTDSVTYWNI